jgi:hypothetical protein
MPEWEAGGANREPSVGSNIIYLEHFLPGVVLHRRKCQQVSAVTPQEMRAKALECEGKARATQDTGVVRMYTELACQWRELADQIERYKR